MISNKQLGSSTDLSDVPHHHHHHHHHTAFPLMNQLQAAAAGSVNLPRLHIAPLSIQSAISNHITAKAIDFLSDVSSLNRNNSLDIENLSVSAAAAAAVVASTAATTTVTKNV